MSRTNDGRRRAIHLPITIDRRSVVEMQRNVTKRGKRNVALRFVLAKGDKDKIAGWNQDLFRVLLVFNVRFDWFDVGIASLAVRFPD